MKHSWLLLVALAACTVPDKFLSDTDGGDDTIDGGGDDDPDGGVDTTPPETTITSAPPDDSNLSVAEFEFEADEDATFLCSFDGETFDDCESPVSRSLSDGPHTFSVRAVDLAGNQDDTPAEHLWNIDTNAPETTITVAPAAVDNSTTASFEFTSDEAGVTFECSDNGSSYSLCVTPHMMGPLTDGSYTFGVRAVDAAGNTDASPDTHAWMVDTSTPDTTILTGPMGSVASTAATFTFNSPDAGAGATFECRLDGAAFATCTSGISYNSLSEASHTFEVRVRDAGGNVDPSPAQRTWTVDVTAPTTTITAAPSGSVNSASANISFSSNEGGTFQCSLDGAAFTTCTTPHPLTGLSQGSHTFAVRAVDAAGNQDATPATATWTVDTIAPDTSIVSGPPAVDDDTTVTFDLSSTESPATYQCSLNMAAFASCNDPAVITVAAGSNNLRVRASDAAGNQDSTPATYTWTTDTTAPVVTFSQAPNNGATTGPYVTFAWTVDDPLATITCTLNGTMIGCSSPISVNIAEGPAQFKVEARDQFSRVGTGERNWTIDCVPQTGGTGAIGLFHFEDALQSQVADNSLSGTDGMLGSTSAVQVGDPTPMAAGRFGTAFRFANSDQDAVYWSPGASANSVEFAVEMWFKPEFQDGLVQDLFRDGNSHFALYQGPVVGNVSIEMQIQDESGTNHYLGMFATVNQWHHLVATFGNGTMTLWVDGVSTSTSGITRTTPFAFANSRIGTYSTFNNTRGVIDEVFLANRRYQAADVLPRYCPMPSITVPACPANYQSIAGQLHKYRSVTTSSPWNSAANDCADDLPGWTHLVVPDNNAEMSSLSGSFPGPRWIGYSDVGAWRTVLGDQPTYFNWDANEPNGATTWAAWYNGSGAWRDDNPANSNPYVCECAGQ